MSQFEKSLIDAQFEPSDCIFEPCSIVVDIIIVISLQFIDTNKR